VGRIEDPRRRGVAQRVFNETAFFREVPSHVNRYLVTPPQRITTTTENLGCGRQRRRGEIDTPKGPLTFVTDFDPAAQTWWQIKYPVETMQDIETIRSIPWELPAGLSPPDCKPESTEFNERGVLRTGVSSPFVCVAGMMKYEWFLELARTEPELIAELTEICRERIVDVLRVLFSKPGIEYVWMGGSEWVTPPMASPAVYDALVQEQERSIIDFIHSQGDVVVHVHCHGHTRHALARTVERGGDYTEPVEPPPDGDITMADAKALVNGRITLGGNVESRILYSESEETVEQATRDAFDGGKRRFVLRPSEGPSPRMTEQEFRNYNRMVDVWDELSPL